eukprot:8349081-Alexandrium_andersonii.AAC.1
MRPAQMARKPQTPLPPASMIGAIQLRGTWRSAALPPRSSRRLLLEALRLGPRSSSPVMMALASSLARLWRSTRCLSSETRKSEATSVEEVLIQLRK